MNYLFNFPTVAKKTVVILAIVSLLTSMLPLAVFTAWAEDIESDTALETIVQTTDVGAGDVSTNTSSSVVDAIVPASLPVEDGAGMMALSMSTCVPVVEIVGDTDCYETLQAAVDAAANGDVIRFLTDVTVTSQVTISKTVTVNGGGHTIFGSFAKTDNSNNAIFGLMGQSNTITLEDLVIDGSGGFNLHGVNVYVSNAVLNDVEIKDNDNAAINVNGSEVTVKNLKTSGHRSNTTFGVIDIGKGSGVTRDPKVTVLGQSLHAETGNAHIRQTLNSNDVVIDINNQYTRSNQFFLSPIVNGRKFVLNPLPVVPTVNPCTLTTTLHTTDMGTWDLSQTQTTGHNELLASGLKVWTESNTSTDKAAGYFTTDFALADAGVPAIEFSSFTGGRPSLQLGVDKDANGTWDGYLVYEPWAYADGYFWSNGNFGISSGMGYTSYGTLNDYLAANPTARVISIGYSLGSGVLGESVISKLTAGCVEYTFGLPPNDVPTLVIDIPTEGQFVSTKLNGDKLAVTGTFTDDEAVNYAQLELVYAGNLVTVYTMHYNDAGLNADGSFSINVPVPSNLAEGEYSLFYTGTDFENGITARMERKFIIDNTAPTAPTITKPTPRQWFKTEPIRNEWTPGTDAGSGIKEYQVAYAYDDAHTFGGSTCSDVTTIDGKTVSGCRNAAGTSRNHTPELSEQGGVTIWVRAVDKAGNVSPWSPSVHYYYDAEAPVGSITYPANEQTIGLVSGKIKVEGPVTDNLSMNRVGVQLIKPGVSGHIVYLYHHMVNSNPGSWQVEIDAASLGLTDGRYGLNLYFVDMAGNVSTKNYFFVLDTTAPDAPVHLTPLDNTVQNINDFYFDWTDVSDAVEYEFQSSQNSAVDANGVLTTGVWNNKAHGGSDRNHLTDSTIHSYGANGTWYWQVRAIDVANNKSPWTAFWKLTIDKEAPAAPTGLAWADVDSNNVPHLGTTGSYSGTASWNPNTEPDINHYIYRYWNEISGSAYNDVSLAWTTSNAGVTLPGVFNQGEGVHHFCVIAVDMAGNESACSDTYTVIYDVVDGGGEEETGVYTIDGYKFHDLNADGDWDIDEPTLGGWTIELWSDDELIATTTTGTGEGQGYYMFEVEEGSYQVKEVQQENWTQTATLGEADGDICYFAFSDEDESMWAKILDFVSSEDMVLYSGQCVFGNHYTAPVVTPEEGSSTSNSSSGSRPNALRTAPAGQVLGASTQQCVWVTDYMQQAIENDVMQVLRLQLFLNLQGWVTPLTGIFDAKTTDNVKLFQVKYYDEIIKPWFEKGIVPHNRPTGFVYKTTSWKINDIMCPGAHPYPSLEGESLSTNVVIN